MVDKLSPRWRKIVVGVSGGSVLAVGIVAIPYPGPGWLIVFAGLAILSKEFPWAARLLKYARGKYDDWNAWIKKQSWFIKSLTAIATLVVVVATLWIINAYGLLNDWFNLGQDWVQSPLIKK